MPFARTSPRRYGVGRHALPRVATILLLTSRPLLAEPEVSPERQRNREQVAALLERRRAEADGHADRFVRRGLLADRTARTIRLDTEATGLKANEIVEFPIITEGSGHDYEALFVAFARPSDVVAALEFIGVPRGRPATPTALAFWPKGERVRIDVEFPDGARRPVEELILDMGNQGRTMSVKGFVHVGSIWTERDGQPHCAADDMGPGSIASSYNEPTTVLDVPRLAQQSEVYERFVANPETLFPKGRFVTLWIAPEPRPDAHPRRVAELSLQVTMPAGATTLAEARFRLTGGGLPADAATQPMADALRTIREFLPDRDPYVTLDLDDNLPLRAMTDLARVLLALDNEDGLRIEPPRAGQLYYRAFHPRAEWRDRAQRMTQPHELRLQRREDGTFQATLVSIEELWDANPDKLRPELRIQEQPVADPAAFAAALAAAKTRLPVLLVFVPGEATLGAFMPYVRAVVATHPTVHVFTEE